MIVETGRVCVKTAGREAGKICVIIEADPKNKNYALIDGNVRRKKCNVRHLKFFPVVVKITKSSSKEDIAKALKSAGFEIKLKEKSKVRKTEKAKKPVKKRIQKKLEAAKPAPKKEKKEKPKAKKEKK